MTTLREAAQMALDALDSDNPDIQLRAATHLRAALAQPKQEPVAWWHDRGDVVDLNVSGHGTPLYFAPPQREFIGLTDEDIRKLSDDCAGVRDENEFIRAIESKLKEKNA